MQRNFAISIFSTYAKLKLTIDDFKRHLCITNRDGGKMDEIISTLDFLSGGISVKLMEACPSMTKHELCYCLLLANGFSKNAILIAMGHKSFQSGYNIRSRLRMKFGLPEDESLEQMLGKIRRQREDLPM